MRRLSADSGFYNAASIMPHTIGTFALDGQNVTKAAISSGALPETRWRQARLSGAYAEGCLPDVTTEIRVE